MSQDLTKQQNPALSTQQNSWVKSEEDKKDLQVPRARIFQGTPTEFDVHPNAKPGQIINSITGEELTGTFIPFMRFKQYAKFNPRNQKDDGFDPKYEPGALIWMTTDSTDPRVSECKFGENGEKPTAIEFMNFMAVFEGQDYPIIIPFSKTSYKTGKKLFSMLAFSGSGFKRKFTLSSKKQQSNGNTYYVLDVNPAGVSDEKEENKAQMFYNQFSIQVSNVKVEKDDINWSE